jgi:hypothetical protein
MTMGGISYTAGVPFFVRNNSTLPWIVYKTMRTLSWLSHCPIPIRLTTWRLCANNFLIHLQRTSNRFRSCDMAFVCSGGKYLSLVWSIPVCCTDTYRMSQLHGYIYVAEILEMSSSRPTIITSISSIVDKACRVIRIVLYFPLMLNGTDKCTNQQSVYYAPMRASVCKDDSLPVKHSFSKA